MTQKTGSFLDLTHNWHNDLRICRFHNVHNIHANTPTTPQKTLDIKSSSSCLSFFHSFLGGQDARTSRLFSAKYMISWYFMIWVHNPLIQRSFSILPATGSQTASHQLDDISSSFSQGTQLILWRMSRRKCGAMSTQSIPTWQSCVPYESAAAFSWCQEDIMRTETWWSCLCLSNQCFTLSPKGVNMALGTLPHLWWSQVVSTSLQMSSNIPWLSLISVNCIELKATQ